MAIYFNPENKFFYLEGKNLSYIFGINRTGFPEHYYFGTRIGRDDLAYTYEANIGDSAEAAVPGKAHAAVFPTTSTGARFPFTATVNSVNARSSFCKRAAAD